MGQLASRAAKLARNVAQSKTLEIPDDVFKLIGFEPRTIQKKILDGDRRFNVRNMHRRAGKSVMEVAKLFERAIENPLPHPRYAYCAPTYAQVKDIVWLYLVSFHENMCRGLGLDPDDWRSASELSVAVPTRAGHKARIRLYGLDSPKQRVRGLYLDGAVLDEYTWIAPTAWTEQIRAMLSDGNRSVDDLKGRKNQWADFSFTPYGRNHAYTLFSKAEQWQKGNATVEIDANTGQETRIASDEWTATTARASETGIISAEELAQIKADIGTAKYMQEFECEFDAAIEGAVYARELAELAGRGGVTATPWLKHLPVHTAWDLGFDDATAIWFFQQSGRQIFVIDYYEARMADLEHYVDVLAERGYRYGRMLFPHDVEQKTLSGGGKSVREQLQQMGVRVTVVPKHRVKDGIFAAKAVLGRCQFDEARTAMGRDRLALYRRKYDERADVFSEAPIHDWTSHAADAFRCLAMGSRKAEGLEGTTREATSVV